MKKGLPPDTYRPVVFRDVAAGVEWLTRSTVRTDRTIVWEDGVEYPLYEVDISSHSPPFFTGRQRIVDTEGRIEKFRRNYDRVPGGT